MAAPFRHVREWQQQWVEHVDSHLDEGEIEGTMSALLAFESSEYMPPRSLVLELLALAIDPYACGLKKQQIQEMAMATEDPFTTTLRSAQLQARNFLSAWVDVDAYGLLRAIPSMRADTRLHEPSDADYPIYRTAHVYSKQQTVWDLLDGSLFATALPKQVFQRIAPSAWEVLEIVIEAWEVDADQHERQGNLHWSPFFHGSFCKNANVEMALTVVISAFSTDAITFPASMDLERRRRTALRLLILYLDLACARDDGQLPESCIKGLNSTCDAFMGSLADLDQATFSIFFAVFPWERERYKIRLLRQFIDSTSKPKDQLPKTLTPRRSPLKAASSLSSLSQGSQSSSSAATAARLRPSQKLLTPPSLREACDQLICRAIQPRRYADDEVVPPALAAMRERRGHHDLLSHALARIELLRELQAHHGTARWRSVIEDDTLSDALLAAGVWPIDAKEVESLPDEDLRWRWQTVADDLAVMLEA